MKRKKGSEVQDCNKRGYADLNFHLYIKGGYILWHWGLHGTEGCCREGQQHKAFRSRIAVSSLCFPAVLIACDPSSVSNFCHFQCTVKSENLYLPYVKNFADNRIIGPILRKQISVSLWHRKQKRKLKGASEYLILLAHLTTVAQLSESKNLCTVLSWSRKRMGVTRQPNVGRGDLEWWCRPLLSLRSLLLPSMCCSFGEIRPSQWRSKICAEFMCEVHCML